VQVLLKTDGRPLNASVELWHGPDNAPQKLGIYIEDGKLRPFSAVVETLRANTIAIRNTGQLELPLAACVLPDADDAIGSDGPIGLAAVIKGLYDMSVPKTIQGGSLHTYSLHPSVERVQVLLRQTNGLPLNATIELFQGPDNVKQVTEVYAEDGRERPFFAVIETPGTGNMLRIVNKAILEFPLTACVEPFHIEPGRL
jgi:hypothetical protein